MRAARFTVDGDTLFVNGLVGLTRTEMTSVLRQALDKGFINYVLPECGERLTWSELSQEGVWGLYYDRIAPPSPIGDVPRNA